MTEEKYLPWDHHGDIMIDVVDAVPEGYVKRESSFAPDIVRADGSVVVGLGEETGHYHVLEQAELYTQEGVDREALARFVLTGEPIPGDVYVRVLRDTPLHHLVGQQPTGDHDTFTIPAGDVFTLRRPREYTPRGARWNVD